MPAGSGPRKRLGIFLAYDADGILDDYVVHLLRDMRPNLTDLIIMVNGKLTDESRTKLLEFSPDVHVRPNEGFDYGGWKEGLLDHCGFDRLRDYDELVFFNDSYFGPLYPFSEVFAEMDKRNVDFWGLTVHGKVKSMGMCPYGDRPRYLQTYFLVFGRKLILAPAFREFWEQQPHYRHVYELADRFGAVMTRHFGDLGFTWSAYSDTTDLEDSSTKNFAHHSYNFEEMIVNRRFPVIKRRTFVTPRWNHLRHNDASKVPEVLDYVQRRYGYDLNLVYDHILRKHDIGDMKNCLNLDFILPGGDSHSTPLPAGKKIAVAVLLLDPDAFPRHLPYLRHIPAEMEMWIATDTEAKQAAIEQALGAGQSNRRRIVKLRPGTSGLAALLEACGPDLQTCDYLCFIHDHQSIRKEFPTVAAHLLDRQWDNTLPDEGFIRQVIATLESHPRIGLLVPPAPYHGSYFRSVIHEEPVRFDRAARLAAKLGLRAPMKKDKPSVTSGTVFWCRTDALKPLFSAPWQELSPPTADPSHAERDQERLDQTLGRLLPYVAQSQGYFTGWALTPRQAAADLTNLHFMLNHVKMALAGTPSVKFDCFASFRLSLANLRKVLCLPGMRGGLAWMGRFRHFAEHRSPAFVQRWFIRFFNRSPK